MPYLTKRTYLSIDGRAVEEDSPDANSLLGAQGDEVTAEVAKATGAETSDKPVAGDTPPSATPVESADEAEDDEEDEDAAPEGEAESGRRRRR